MRRLPPSDNRAVRVVLLCAVLGAYVLLTSVQRHIELSLEAVLALYFFVPLYIGIWVHRLMTRVIDVLEPMNIVGLLFLVCYLLNILLFYDVGHPYFRGLINPGRTLFVFSLGAASFMVGSLIATHRRSAMRPQSVQTSDYDWKRVQTYLVALWCATAIVRLALFLWKGHGAVPALRVQDADEFSNMLSMPQYVNRYVLFMLAIVGPSSETLTKKKKAGKAFALLLLGMLAFEVGLTTILGWKSGIVVYPVVFSAIFLRSKLRTVKRILVYAVVMLIVILPAMKFAFAMIWSYRYQNTIGMTVEALTEAGEMALEGNVGAQPADSYLGRLAQGNFLDRVIYAVDSGEVAIRVGDTLWPGFVWFVPRALWPDKPNIAVGKWYARNVLGWSSGNAAVTVLGDFYLNFGIGGVVVGMLVLGLLVGLLHRYLTNRRNQMVGLFLFVPVFLASANVERGFATIFTEMSHGLLLVLAVVIAPVWVFFRTRRSSPSTLGGRGLDHRFANPASRSIPRG